MHACALCGKAARHKCSRCFTVRYCSAACQKEHWHAGHREACAAARRAARRSACEPAAEQGGAVAGRRAARAGPQPRRVAPLGRSAMEAGCTAASAAARAAAACCRASRRLALRALGVATVAVRVLFGSPWACIGAAALTEWAVQPPVDAETRARLAYHPPTEPVTLAGHSLGFVALLGLLTAMGAVACVGMSDRRSFARVMFGTLWPVGLCHAIAKCALLALYLCAPLWLWLRRGWSGAHLVCCALKAGVLLASNVLGAQQPGEAGGFDGEKDGKAPASKRLRANARVALSIVLLATGELSPLSPLLLAPGADGAAPSLMPWLVREGLLLNAWFTASHGCWMWPFHVANAGAWHRLFSESTRYTDQSPLALMVSVSLRCRAAAVAALRAGMSA